MNAEKNTGKNGHAPLKTEKQQDFKGYPIYPANEDIYNRQRNETEIDPEQLSLHKTPNEANESNNELDFTEDISGGDLDVPGSELDDAQEQIGNEDEENNYYSLGGDAHIDLDEQNGE